MQVRDDDLRRYYDSEAEARARQPAAGHREELRDDLIATLDDGAPSLVVDVGAGPGRDGQAFVDAGHRYVGVDLAFANAELAATHGLMVIQGSLFDLPVASSCADVVWTMSTLLHVPDDRFHEAVSELVGVLRPGGVMAIGLWGGIDRQWVNETDHFDPPRFFAQRSHSRLRSLVAEHGEVVHFETWPAHTDWEYQFVVLQP